MDKQCCHRLDKKGGIVWNRVPIPESSLTRCRTWTFALYDGLPKRERILDFIRQIGNPYCYRHGKYVVKVSFTDTDVTLEDRMLSYIRSKC